MISRGSSTWFVELTIDSIDSKLLYQCQRRLSETLTACRDSSYTSKRLTAFPASTDRQYNP